MIIAVDGPLASGKGTIARALAARFGLPHLDTGTLYRATGLAVMDTGTNPADAEACAKLARNLNINRIDGDRIRTAEAGAMASKVASIPQVRDALFELQRAFATQPALATARSNCRVRRRVTARPFGIRATRAFGTSAICWPVFPV